MRYYQIGEAAELTGLSRDTLRFYEKKGLIRSERKENGYRLYNENDLAALISIKYRRHMNHSIGDIEKDLIGSLHRKTARSRSRDAKSGPRIKPLRRYSS